MSIKSKVSLKNISFKNERPSLKRPVSLTNLGDINVVVDPSDNNNNNKSDDTTPAPKSENDPNKPKEAEEKHKKNQLVLNPNHTIGYNDVVTLLRDTYHFDENINSTALDILALYLRGQKIIYMESKTYCESRLNSLMIPAIFISAACSILNYILKDVNSGTIVISGLNAFNSFILTIINYLKLAEKSQNHLIAAQRFHNLEARLELQSGRSLFFNNSNEIKHALEEMEKEIKEIQSSDQFLVPEAIRYRYPKIFSSNIFSLVKEIKNEEIIHINKLKSVVQKIHQFTKRRDHLINKRLNTYELIAQYKKDIHQMELDMEVYNVELRAYVNNEDDAKKLDEYALKLHDDKLLNNPIYTNPLDTVSEEEDNVEPPELQLPDSNVESGELYNQIVEWKKQYDDFLSKKKEQDDYYYTEYQKLQEKYVKNMEQKEHMQTSLALKITIKHMKLCLDEEDAHLKSLNKEIGELEETINHFDHRKDDAFSEIVEHRQRYINLSREMNSEIQRNIDAKNKWYKCNPYEFFNT